LAEEYSEEPQHWIPGEAWRAGTIPDSTLREARIQHLHLLRAVGDDGVADRVERYLADPSLAPDPAEEARLLLLGGASQIAAGTEGAVERGRERVRRALELGLGAEARFFAHLELAEAALRNERLDEAAAELAAARARLAADDCAQAAAQEAARLVALEARNRRKRRKRA
jgi:hypothetical protein